MLKRVEGETNRERERERVKNENACIIGVKAFAL
jgi:hypothetical protein